MADGCLGIEILIDFVDGRAEPAKRAIVERHASRCEDCRTTLASLVRTGTAGSGEAAVDSPVAVSSRPSMLAIGAQVGRYVIAREVGAGGMGAVYAAHDPELGRMVAVKVLRRWGDRYMQARLRREAQAMARLAHPNVVAVHDVGAFGDQIFIAMEYVEGETLARWLASPRSQRAVLDAFRAAGAGLAAAHAAGIVHRDFKPENVLIGNNGRVCVGDFGLARAAGTGEMTAPIRPVSDPRSVSDDLDDLEEVGSSTEPADRDSVQPERAAAMQPDLTVPGILVGTPYYMAPEIYDGAPADERSDQFSFCVALVTALHGQRLSKAEMVDGKTRATGLRERIGSCRLPRWIRAALHRGLASDPAARFASVADLLAELAPPDRTARWIGAAGAAALAGVAVVGWYAMHNAPAIDQRCTGAAAAYAPTWSPERRAALQAAFAATHALFATEAFRQVASSLDRYATRWTEAHTATCRATRILGEQTEAMLDLRMTCLERRRQDAAALIGTLATADLAMLTRAVGAAAGLPDIAACADVAALQQVIPPPRDAATRAKLAALTPRLADAHAKFETGSYATALALVRPIAAEARALGYRPFEAEAEYLQGVLEVELGDAAHAEPTLQAAGLAAEAGRHDEIAARARTALVSLVGEVKAEYARALALAPFAVAAIARMGGNPDIESQLEEALGGIAHKQSQIDVATDHFERALVIEERVHGPDDPRTAQAVHGMGVVTMAQGHPTRAAEWLERALAINERALGPNHPLVARELHSLGSVLVADGRLELAVADLRRALAIREIALGTDHPTYADNLTALARALRTVHQDDEALALDRRAVAISERVNGPDHPQYAHQLMGLGNTLGRMGRYAEAAEHLHHAEAIFTKVYGPGHDNVMRVRAVLGEMLTAQSRWKEVVEYYATTIPGLEKAHDIGDWLAIARLNLAQAELALHHPARALAAVEPLWREIDAQLPRIGGYTRYLMARALWDQRGELRRVRDLVTVGRAQLVAAGPAAADELADLDGWLERTPGARPPAP